MPVQIQIKATILLKIQSYIQNYAMANIDKTKEGIYRIQ